MSAIHALFGLVCIAALVVAVLAGASYSQTYDIGNKTDSYGNAPSAQANNTGQVAAATSQGLTGLSGAYLILFAAFFLVVFIIAGIVFLGKPKW